MRQDDDKKVAMSLEHKSVLITGGAQGIGKAISIQCLKEGASIVIVDADQEACQETCHELKNFGTIDCIYGDVADENLAKHCAQFCQSRFSTLDVLINNAGIMVTKPLQALTLVEWNKVINTNLTSAFLFTKYATPLLKGSQAGSIINIASTRALMSEPDTESYAASKGGLLALTHAMAMSLGPTVRVNSISPGWIDTSDWQKSSQRQTSSLTESDHAQHPVGRVGRPEDIAHMVIYLASDQAKFITGANFVIDGGMTKKMIYQA